MSDVPGGRYAKTNPYWGLLGQLTNAVDPTQPARSNLEFFGLANPTDGALAATGIACCVPVPVDPGQYISTVSLLIGATAGGTMTHQFVALYSGTNVAAPPLIGQSTDSTSAAIAASGVASWNLTAVQQITAAQAPNGFIYVAVAITATTVPSAMVVSTPAAIGYQWFSATTTPKGASPLFLSATAGSALAGTAAATIASPAAKAVAPIVILT